MPEIKNPQQEPGDFQRLLLVFALTFIAIAASQFFLSKFGPRPEPKPEDKSSQQQQVTAPANNPPGGTVQTSPSGQANAPSMAAPPAGKHEAGKTAKGPTKPAAAPTTVAA